MDIYNDFSSYLKNRYGEKVYKIPIGLQLTCPNRDGTCGTGGCTFCGEIGASYETRDKSYSIRQQIEDSITHISQKHKANLFIPYFLNFSNTYMPLDIFRQYLIEASDNEKVVAVYIATRPDCINDEYLSVMSEVKQKYNVDICIELGLQSINHHTLKKINRGHSMAEFIDAVMIIKQYHLEICTHLILNLPWDNDDDAVESARVLSALRIDQVKLHSLFIVKGTPLAKSYEAGEFSIITCDEYINRVILFLENLSPDIVIQRIIGRAQKENTLFSNWNEPFFVIRDKILSKMKEKGSYQGKSCNYLSGKALKNFI